MSLLIPIIGGGALIAALVAGRKKSDSVATEIDSGIDENSLFNEVDSTSADSTKAQDSITVPSTTPASTAPASNASSTTTKPVKNSTTLPYPNYPLVMFSRSNVGTFSPATLISKMQVAIKSKNVQQMAVAFKEFLALNNDQVRYFHNIYFKTYKVTPYIGWKNVRLTTGQQYIATLLSKLNSAGAGEKPKEKI